MSRNRKAQCRFQYLDRVRGCEIVIIIFWKALPSSEQTLINVIVLKLVIQQLYEKIKNMLFELSRIQCIP